MNEEFWAKISKFYQLPPGVDFLDVTDALLKSELVKPETKQHILSTERRIYIFEYKSDGYKVRATLSAVPHPEKEKTIIYLRGGNKDFAIPHPAGDILTYKRYTFITSTLRGGFNEGIDEFGGEDVNDIKHLIDYLHSLKMPFQQEKMILLGGSRGGMQMFLFLKKYPDYQARFERAISLCGLSDLENLISYRKDMVDMLKEEFGYNESAEWIEKRNPLQAISNISLPVFIIHGTHDERVHLEDAKKLESCLKEAQKKVFFIQVENGNHLLSNIENRMDIVEKAITQKVV